MTACKRLALLAVFFGWTTVISCARAGQPLSPNSAAAQTNDGTSNVIVRFAPSEKIKLQSESVSVRVPLPENAGNTILQAAKSDAAGHRLYLKLTGIEYQQNPGAGYEIYLDLPAGQASDRKSPNYAGVLHFFGLKQTAETTGTPAGAQFNITECVRRLQQANQWNDSQLTVTFVRRGPTAPSGATTAPTPEAVPSIAELDIVAE